MNEEQQKMHGQLKRGLKNRHIQLIALGGAIGTGLFLGTAPTIKMAGPAVILGYAIGGLIVFMIMRQLGEMVAEEPIAGSFSYFAYKYWGDYPGFLTGWTYWVLYILVSISELTAVGAYVQYWWPTIPTWLTALAFFVVITAINLATVKIYGEAEFWFAIIKVAAIVAMIILGFYLLYIHPELVPGATVRNLWDPATGGFLPNGIYGLIIALPIVMFSFGGLELVGIAASEADDPQKTIPMAINQVIYRIFIFYIGALFVLLSLYHWNQVGEEGSPFVMIFHKLGFEYAAGILNFVILTAALSVYNSGVYCNSRMLFGLAMQGNAPKVFASTDHRGVPMASTLLSAGATLLCVVLNYMIPQWADALKFAMSVVVAALIINWAMISLSHLKFRNQKDSEGHKNCFPSMWFPWSNYICLVFVVFILGVMYHIGMKAAVLAVPVWLVMTYVGYKLKLKYSAKK